MFFHLHLPCSAGKYQGFVCYKNIVVEEKHSRLQGQTAVVLQTVCSGLCRSGVVLDERPKSLLFLGVGPWLKMTGEILDKKKLA